MRRTAVISALVCAGCGGAQHFDATERATASSPRGDVAAEYDIREEGGPRAEVKVWTRGAYESSVEGREMTVLEVVFEVENDGPTPIELAGIKLDSALARGVSFDDLAPFRVDGDVAVGPGDEARVHAFFALEERYDPEDIATFEVEWSLAHAGGTYAQRTPFQQAPEYYYSAYPYPYTYSPYGFGPRPLYGAYYP